MRADPLEKIEKICHEECWLIRGELLSRIKERVQAECPDVYVDDYGATFRSVVPRATRLGCKEAPGQECDLSRIQAPVVMPIASFDWPAE